MAQIILTVNTDPHQKMNQQIVDTKHSEQHYHQFSNYKYTLFNRKLLNEIKWCLLVCKHDVPHVHILLEMSNMYIHVCVHFQCNVPCTTL